MVHPLLGLGLIQPVVAVREDLLLLLLVPLRPLHQGLPALNNLTMDNVEGTLLSCFPWKVIDSIIPFLELAITDPPLA